MFVCQLHMPDCDEAVSQALIYFHSISQVYARNRNPVVHKDMKCLLDYKFNVQINWYDYQ